MDARIWRYMDLAKFVSLLQTSSLYFCRADLLGDAHEGSISGLTLEGLRAQEKHIEATEGASGLIDSIRRGATWFRSQTFVNCWRVNEDESAAMWKLYSIADQGIAITSTYRKLQHELGDDIFLGSVRYINYENEGFALDNAFNAYLYKRVSFSHEQEVRAIVSLFSSASKHRAPPDAESLAGVMEKVDLSRLIGDLCASLQPRVVSELSGWAGGPVWFG